MVEDEFVGAAGAVPEDQEDVCARDWSVGSGVYLEDEAGSADGKDDGVG